MDVSSDLLSLSSASPLSSIFIISPLFAFQTHCGGNTIMSYAYLLVMSHYIKPSSCSNVIISNAYLLQPKTCNPSQRWFPKFTSMAYQLVVAQVMKTLSGASVISFA